MEAVTKKTLNILISSILLSTITTYAQNLASGQTDLVLLPCTLKIETSQYPCEQQVTQFGGLSQLSDQMSSNQQQTVSPMASQFEQPVASQQVMPLSTNNIPTLASIQTSPLPLQQQPLFSNFRLTKLADLVQILPPEIQVQPNIPSVIETAEPETIEFDPTPPMPPTTKIPLTLPLMAMPLCPKNWLSIAPARLCSSVGPPTDTIFNSQANLPSSYDTPMRTKTFIESPTEQQNYLSNSFTANGLSQTLIPRSTTSSLDKIHSLNSNLFLPTSKTTNFNFANSRLYSPTPSNNIPSINGNIKAIRGMGRIKQ